MCPALIAVLFLVLGAPPDALGQALARLPVVVAPFVERAPASSGAPLCPGAADTLGGELRRRGWTVVTAPPGAIGRPAGASGDATDQENEAIALSKYLGAASVLVGGCERVGSRLRVSTRLLDVDSGRIREEVIIDGSIADWPEARGRLVAAVGEALERFGDRGVPSASGGTRSRRPVQEAPPPSLAGPAGVNAVNGLVEWDGAPAAGASGGQSRGVQGRGGFAAAPLGGPAHVTVGRTAEPPAIDGRLDDHVWEAATHIAEFVQVAPIEGAPGSEDTEVWLAYDSENLYVAFYAHYSNPGSMRTNRADRDQIRGDDRMSVLFDPFLDQQRAYQFEVNGYGVQSDSLVNADGSRGASGSQSPAARAAGGSSGPRRGSSGLGNSGQFGISGDDSWDALFETAGQVVDDGWTAEMAIPFKSLRYPSTPPSPDGHRWGFQITRIIRSKSEAQAWSPVSRSVAGQLTQFGTIDGLSDLSRSRNLELLPEVTGVQIGSLDADSGDYTERDPDGEFGIGVKYGITPNLTADFTYNPDFSQIESDRPQVETNQRFALFYPEQRPFFLEGQEIFATATPLNLLHTRTIVDPQLGGKVTGKVGRTTLGVMVADDEAAGRFDDAGDPRFGRSATTFVGRARYDLYPESYVGAIMTAREFGEEHSRVGGVDTRFRLGRTHRLSFMAVGSSTATSEEGELSGPAIEADFTREGRNLSYSAAYSSIDPEFRSGTGFVPRVDLRQTTGRVGYRWWPESTLITWGPSVTYLRLYDHAGLLQDEQIGGEASFSFQNNISVTGTLSRDLERYAGIDFRKNSYGFFGVVSGRLVSVVGGYNWGDGVLFSDNPFLGRATTGNFLISARPTSRLRAELTGVFSRFVDPRDRAEVYDVKIFRTRTTYQFTGRLLLRHIAEHNTQTKTLGNNVLLTYRLNAGTVAFLGYDDRYQQGSLIDGLRFPTTALERTNRAFFGKISYLFRY